ncbi:restriction endonuclease subunit S [Vibrio splendidus]
MKNLAFNDVIMDVTSKFRKIKKTEYQDTGPYKIIDQGKNHIAGYISSKESVTSKYLPIIIFGDHTRVLKYENSPIALGADGAKALYCNPEYAYPKYVYYFLKELKLEGVGYSRHFKFLKENKIPIPFDGDKPNINDQIRIAYLLGKVEALLAQRNQQLQEMDELLNSVFLQMFGDPVRNEKGWDKKPLGKLLSQIDSGWSPKCETVPAQNDQWGVLKLGAVTLGEYKQNENKAMFPDVEPKIQHEVKVGDLLFTRKNTYELVAATAFVYKTQPRLLLPDLIFRLVIKDENEIHPIYLWKLLSYPSQRKKTQSLAGGAAGSMPNISKASLKSALIPVPGLELQLRFVEIVRKIEAVKDLFKNHLNDLELLYGSLSQKAFKGELDLSSIQLPEVFELQAEYNKDVENEFLKVNQLQSKIGRVTNTLESINKPFELIENLTQPIEQLTKPITQYVEDFSSLKVTPDFSNDKIRQKWLVKLLNEQLTALDIDCLLALSEFWKFAQDWISNFEQEDGDSFSFSIDDYEVLKNFVFNEVRNGLLLQEYEEASNSIKFKVNKK